MFLEPSNPSNLIKQSHEDYGKADGSFSQSLVCSQLSIFSVENGLRGQRGVGRRVRERSQLTESQAKGQNMSRSFQEQMTKATGKKVGVRWPRRDPQRN